MSNRDVNRVELERRLDETKILLRVSHLAFVRDFGWDGLSGRFLRIVIEVVAEKLNKPYALEIHPHPSPDLSSGEFAEFYMFRLLSESDS